MDEGIAGPGYLICIVHWAARFMGKGKIGHLAASQKSVENWVTIRQSTGTASCQQAGWFVLAAGLINKH